MLIGLLFTVGAGILGFGIGFVQSNPQGWTYIVGGVLILVFGAWVADRSGGRVAILDKSGAPRAKAKKVHRIKVRRAS